MVGGQQPDGSIPQDRGRVNAIRFHPGDQPKISPVKSKAAVRRHVDPDYDKHVVYSKAQRSEGGRAARGDGSDEGDDLRPSLQHGPARTSSWLRGVTLRGRIGQ